MNTQYYLKITIMLSLMFTLALTACQPEQVTQASSDEQQLATARVSAQLSNQAGRAIVSARGNHFIVDSVPPLEGPNEEVNPLDMMLGALATCGLFVAERTSQELDIPLYNMLASVEGDLDPSGVTGSGTNPRLQVIRIHLNLEGANREQMGQLVENFTARCPIYTTLSRGTDIQITVGDETPAAAMEGLATAKVVAQLSNQPGRAIVSARGNHFVIDSVPPLAGPNEERNPLDLMLGALATCSTFIFERVAQEQNITLTDLTTQVEGEFDPRGVAGEPVDPRIQTMRVIINAGDIDEAQADLMTEQFQLRCPIYTTLSGAVPIEVTVMTE